MEFPVHDTCAGIYIHIPFCIRKCAYCDFLSAPAGKEERERYLVCLNQELFEVCRKMEAAGQAVSTIYFGGGTPSILSGGQILQLMDTLKAGAQILPGAEITLEMNPGTVTEEKLECFQKAGINRLSIGAQSFQEEELKLLGRIHSAEDFMKAYKMARSIGFSNISLDLMSGLPGQSLECWQKNLETAVCLNPEHISAYSLIIEEGTPFYDRYGVSWSEENEELDRQMYEATKEILAKAGYLRYEISNYAKPGYESRHNTSYWTGVPYYGCGLGASSLIKRPEGWFRTRNQTKLLAYFQNFEKKEASKAECVKKKEFKADFAKNGGFKADSAKNGGFEAGTETCFEEEVLLTRQERMEEFMFLGLRLTRGIDIRRFEAEFGQKFDPVYGDCVRELIYDGLMQQNGDRLALTDRGLDLSNYCFEKFLL